MAAKKSVRRAIKYGTSIAITLPAEYVKLKGIKPGDEFEIIFDDYVHIVPIDAEKLEKKVEKAKELLEEA